MAKFLKSLSDAKIFYRITPNNVTDWENFRIIQNKNVHFCCQKKDMFGKRIPEYREYETDGVFYDVKQEIVFESVIGDTLERLLKGHNVVVMAFGPTGSGKSLTIIGAENFFNDRGILPRVIEKLFYLKENAESHLRITYQLSYLEVLSSNRAHDLLKSYPTVIDQRTLRNLTKIKVNDTLETLKHVFQAEGKKELNPKAMYSSHLGSSILTIWVTVQNMDLSEPHQTVSYLHLIDLAGTDVIGRTIPTTLKQKKYVSSANSTFSYFNYFLTLLQEDDQELMQLKERSNIMSQYLKGHINRDSLMRFVGHLKITEEYSFLTHSMLRFGHKIKGLKPKGTMVYLQDNELIKTQIFQKKIDDLKKQQAICKMLKECKFAETSMQVFSSLEKTVDDYVKDRIDEMSLLDLVDLNHALAILKNKVIPSQNTNIAKPTEVAPKKEEEKTKPTTKKLHRESETAIKKKVRPSESEEPELKADPKSDTKFNKKNKTSTGSLHKKSFTLKKNITESVVSERKESKLGNSLLSAANLLLPDSFPGHKDALKEYITSDKTMFKNAIDTFRYQDNEAKNAYREYMMEVTRLHELLEIFDLRKMELLQAKMMRECTKKDEYDSDSNIIRSELEEKCMEKYETSKMKAIDQQEVVLNLQGKFKLALSLKAQLKNQVKKEFDEFCKERFNISLPNLTDINENLDENEINVEEYCRDLTEIFEAEKVEDKYAKQYQTLREETAKEMDKKQAYLRKQICWT